VASLLQNKKQKPHSGIGSSYIEVFSVNGAYQKVLKKQSYQATTPLEVLPQNSETLEQLEPLLSPEEITFQNSNISNEQRLKKKQANTLSKEKRKKRNYLIASGLISIAFGLGINFEKPKLKNIKIENRLPAENTVKKNTIAKSTAAKDTAIKRTVGENITKNKNRINPNIKEKNITKKDTAKRDTRTKSSIDPTEAELIEELTKLGLPLENQHLTENHYQAEQNISEIEAETNEIIENIEEKILEEIESDEELQKIIAGEEFPLAPN